MKVLIAVHDPELRRFFMRALSALGHEPRQEAALQFPHILIVDAGPGLLVLRPQGAGRRILRKPFTLKELQEALAAA